MQNAKCGMQNPVGAAAGKIMEEGRIMAGQNHILVVTEKPARRTALEK